MTLISRCNKLISTGIGLAGAGAAVASNLGKPGGALVKGVSRARQIQSNDTVPIEADVVVIGGGFVGCAAALTLAERGVSVVICEKGVVAGEASGRAMGLIEGLFLDPIKLELIDRSKQLWASMNERVGTDTGYRPSGVLLLFQSEQEIASAELWLQEAASRSFDQGRMLSPNEVRNIVGDGPVQWSGGLLGPTEASAEPKLAAPAMAEAAQRRGAIILQECAARGIETQAGKIEAVVTEHGRIKTQTVVLAGGVWSPLFARSLGIELPQFQAYANVLSIDPVPGPDKAVFSGNAVSCRRELDGGYSVCTVNGAAPVTPDTLRYLPKLLPVLGNMGSQLDPIFSVSTFYRELRYPKFWSLDRKSPFEEIRIFQPELRDRRLEKLLANLKHTFPAFAQAKVREKWGGALVSTLDNMPVISSVDSLPGLFLGTGFYYGVTMAPAAGEALADLVTGETPKIDLQPYRYERFIDGTKLIFRD